MTMTAPSAVAAPVNAQAGYIYAYQNVNIRQHPTSGSAHQGVMYAGEHMTGLCWTRGETIRDNGVTNDIWISTGVSRSQGYSFFVSAVYLKGDERGGVPVEDRC